MRHAGRKGETGDGAGGRQSRRRQETRKARSYDSARRWKMAREAVEFPAHLWAGGTAADAQDPPGGGVDFMAPE